MSQTKNSVIMIYFFNQAKICTDSDITTTIYQANIVTIWMIVKLYCKNKSSFFLHLSPLTRSLFFKKVYRIQYHIPIYFVLLHYWVCIIKHRSVHVIGQKANVQCIYILLIDLQLQIRTSNITIKIGNRIMNMTT